MKTIQKTLCIVALSGTALAGFAQAPIVRQPPSNPNYDPSQPQGQTYPQQPQQGYPNSAGEYSTPPDQGQYAPPPPQEQQQPSPYQGAPEQAAPDQGPPPQAVAPQQLDQLVQRIALYPDPLLAQVLTASTYGNEIPDAAGWADQHSDLKGDDLSEAIQNDNLPWDPSVLALLPFPSVLDMMASDPGWTQQLGDAVLVQRQDVMDAVQRARRAAQSYGYLTSNGYDNVVDENGYIAIEPLNPTLLYVPVYDPRVVFYAPRPGFYVGGAIHFRPAITIGTGFGRYGWFGAGFAWSNHSIFIDRRPWGRTWVNRGTYVHPYVRPYVRPAGPRTEIHREEHMEQRRDSRRR